MRSSCNNYLRRTLFFVIASVGLFTILGPARVSSALGGDATVAVATNFSEALQTLESQFEASSGHGLTIVTGSTGKLYAQITKGAPFDVLLAADRVRPEKLAAAGFAVPGSRFTYAIGILSLWSPDPGRWGEIGFETLKKGDFRHIAIANPDLAPYGLAARQTMQNLGVYQALLSKIVIGQNVGQAFSLVATGNAELGLVAKSYAISPRNGNPGSRWDVPPEVYSPIRQDAILLQSGADNPAALAFLAFLGSRQAREIIAKFGYGLD